ncbi:putative f-box domain protein [Phaeomoniella chlamydospora]|uniref:Putative f-box domain protein n=1 Tax=Phaeomoniella chlamydospora TaxID=158046 RepID=A0A0G2GIL8_PHACM|nr:putative f-box domain protein [Phaeomoniella chlamydospora]
MKIIAHNCPHLEYLNIDWCSGIDTKGLRRVLQACPKLTDLRASELRGLDDQSFMLELFNRNTVERLFLSHCDSLNDDSLKVLFQGLDPEIDVLTERAIVPPRRLRHLDISRCRTLTDDGVKSMAYHVPFLEGLRLGQNTTLTDDALMDIFESGPALTHLDMDDLENITNASLQSLAKSPAIDQLKHLSISFCEQVGDVGMLPVLKAATNVTSLVLDNTRVSDLVLMEAADMVRRRGSTEGRTSKPKQGLTLICFDCLNVTWAGVREVLNKNAYVMQARGAARFAPNKAMPVVSIQESNGGSSSSSMNDVTTPFPVVAVPRLLYPAQYTSLKCFYGWQMTVDEHTKRVLRGNWSNASRLEMKWANWMIANEEMGAGTNLGGVVGRRRRRRAREAERTFLEDEDGLDGDDGSGNNARRRRARSGGCTVM